MAGIKPNNMTLQIYLTNLTSQDFVGVITETERYELLKYGVNALTQLSLEKQVLICQNFVDVFKR